MASIDIKQLLKELKEESATLAKQVFKELKNDAESDALGLISSLEMDIKTWTLMLANGELTKDEFEWLVMAKKDLIEMIALKHAGISLIKLDELKAKLLNLLITKVFSLI